MKRFWDKAAATAQPDGFGVALDGKPVRLPGGAALLVPNLALAEAIAAEWAAAGGGAKGGDMAMHDVPLTRLAGTAQERIAPNPVNQVLGLAQYGQTDLLCYRAADRKLAAEQTLRWQPLLDWAALELDAALMVTTGLMPVPQPEPALAALRRALSRCSVLELAALGVLVPALGSLVLGLAVRHARLDAAEAHALSVLDETFQEEFWGTDPEAERRRHRGRTEAELAARLFALSR